jgi:mono/diheme cytochrome c family protein
MNPIRLLLKGLLIASLMALLTLSFGGAYLYWDVKERMAKDWPIPTDLPPNWDSLPGDRELGERIVRVRNGCVDCHGNRLEGKIFLQDSMMGEFAGANLTSSKWKDWTDGEMVRAIRHGVGKDGKSLLFMPSHEFANLSLSDIKALITYLRSIPSVEIPDPPIIPGPLFYALVGTRELPIGLAAEAVDHTQPYPDKPNEEITPQFGAYLVQSACIGCHGANLSGGPIQGAPPDWPQARDIRGTKGLMRWTEEDFIRALKTGTNPNHETIKPPMPIHLTAQMTDVELKAIWAYLKEL